MYLTVRRSGQKPQATMMVLPALSIGLGVFLIVSVLGSVHGISTDGVAAENELLRAITSLKGIITYFTKNYKQVNLDAVIGTRMMDGQLKVLLSRLKATNIILRQDCLEAIKELQAAAEEISDSAIPYIAKNAPAYYQKIGPILNRGFWEINVPSRDLDPALVIPATGQGEAMHEEDSDNCLAEFLGTGQHTEVPCTISNRCWRLMTQPGYQSYSLSHQVFYLQIGHQFGCGAQMIQKAINQGQSSPDDLAEGFCANMLAEAKKIADANFPVNKQDLFMEQAALCGMLGYRQFFTAEWLDTILNWQDRRGCYVIQPGEFGLARVGNSDFKRHRVKREEKYLEHGCLCHRTTVAGGAISQYVRYIIEYLMSPQAAG